MAFRFTTRAGHPTFVDLPWDRALTDWGSDRLVSPVRGISRHVVRFVAYGPDVYALKELPGHLAAREYQLLRALDERSMPVVEAVGTATGRTTADGEPLDDVLITHHLEYSLPYRALFSRATLVDLWDSLLDALAQLLAQAHLAGFFWGDCSLSNTLFRRDAGALAAYLVDAETGELHDRLSDGQRRHDLEIAEMNVAGELVSDYHDAAEQIGAAVSANAAAFAGCSFGSQAEARACAAQVAERFGRRAYRRPLTSAETATFEGFLVTQAEEHGFEAALGMFVQGVLLSPGFLYRPEWGTPDPRAPDAVPLDAYELASRLSYFLWRSMPDDRLFAAAESGALSTPGGLREEAERLLADPRAREAVADFHRQWMDLDALQQTSRDAALFPAWDDAAVRPALAEATAMYLDHVFWDSEGTVSELLTTPKAYVNDAIAPLYGITPPATDELVLVDLDPSERAGFLTQVGPMAAMAHEKLDAPILRGVFVLRKILCAKLGAPPPNVPDIPPAMQGERPKTTRQRIEQSHSDAACAGCHDRIDPLGFAFNHYDAAGQWRAEESGLPIDATGESPELGAYDGAIELSRALAESEDVRACVVTQWFRFAMGRTEAPADACALARLTGSFAENGGTMRDLVRDIVLSDSFRYRSPLGGAP